MIDNRLRQHLQDDRPAFGLFTNISDPMIIELCGLAGFDFVHIDLQHNARGGETVIEMLRAAQAWDMGTLLRCPSPHSELFSRLLDIGVDAVIAPDVRGYDDVRAVIDSTRYPPLGKHGVGSSAIKFRRAELEPGERLPQYLNRTQVVGVMIETVEAIDDLERIVSVPGLDFVFFGPSDLSFAMGDAEPAAVREVIMAGVEIVKKAGIHWGTMPSHPAVAMSCDEVVELGARVIVLGADVAVISQALEKVSANFAHLKG